MKLSDLWAKRPTDAAADSATTFTEAVKGSFEEKQQVLSNKLRELYGEREWPYIRATFEDYIVLQVGGKTYKRTYTVSEDEITFGDPTEVTLSEIVEPAESDAAEIDLAGDIVPLIEAGAIRADGTTNIQIATPGWGTSGFYAKEVLQRDVPKIFPVGTKMYWDHPTDTEEAERPEGSLKTLAAEFISKPVWMEAAPKEGRKEAGMVVSAKVFGPYQPAIEELRNHIGVSLRALGRAKEGTAEGRSGPIIEKLVHGKSVDFVTQAGRGGKILEVFEAARSRAVGKPAPEPEKEFEMDEADLKRIVSEALAPVTEQLTKVQTELGEVKADNSRLGEALRMKGTREYVLAVLEGAEYRSLTKVTKERIASAIAANPPLTDKGDRDDVKLAETIKDRADSERRYLAEAAGFGKIRHMGGFDPFAESAERKPEEVTQSLSESFLALGMSEDAAKKAAAGRG